MYKGTPKEFDKLLLQLCQLRQSDQIKFICNEKDLEERNKQDDALIQTRRLSGTLSAASVEGAINHSTVGISSPPNTSKRDSLEGIESRLEQFEEDY